MPPYSNVEAIPDHLPPPIQHWIGGYGAHEPYSWSGYLSVKDHGGSCMSISSKNVNSRANHQRRVSWSSKLLIHACEVDEAMRSVCPVCAFLKYVAPKIRRTINIASSCSCKAQNMGFHWKIRFSFVFSWKTFKKTWFCLRNSCKTLQKPCVFVEDV